MYLFVCVHSRNLNFIYQSKLRHCITKDYFFLGHVIILVLCACILGSMYYLCAAYVAFTCYANHVNIGLTP